MTAASRKDMTAVFRGNDTRSFAGLDAAALECRTTGSKRKQSTSLGVRHGIAQVPPSVVETETLVGCWLLSPSVPCVRPILANSPDFELRDGNLALSAEELRVVPATRRAAPR